MNISKFDPEFNVYIDYIVISYEELNLIDELGLYHYNPSYDGRVLTVHCPELIELRKKKLYKLLM